MLSQDVCIGAVAPSWMSKDFAAMYNSTKTRDAQVN